MAWKARNNYQRTDPFVSDYLNDLADDIRKWGGMVDADGNDLTNLGNVSFGAGKTLTNLLLGGVANANGKDFLNLGSLTFVAGGAVVNPHHITLTGDNKPINWMFDQNKGWRWVVGIDEHFYLQHTNNLWGDTTITPIRVEKDGRIVCGSAGMRVEPNGEVIFGGGTRPTASERVLLPGNAGIASGDGTCTTPYAKMFFGLMGDVNQGTLYPWITFMVKSSGYYNSPLSEILVLTRSGPRFPTIPTSPSGLYPGDIWCDAAAGNVLKRVP